MLVLVAWQVSPTGHPTNQPNSQSTTRWLVGHWLAFSDRDVGRLACVIGRAD
jgi:hypothetical protein